MPGRRPDLGKQHSGDVKKPASGEEDARELLTKKKNLILA
jgi:hypothetical protein